MKVPGKVQLYSAFYFSVLHFSRHFHLYVKITLEYGSQDPANNAPLADQF